MFDIHPQLQADTHDLGRFDLSCVRLHRAATIPWFILVPQVDVLETFELSGPQRSQLTEEIDRLARFVKNEPAVEKINMASIGNLVPQMHIHVIGRSSRDAFWPGVVWGEDLGDQVYGDEQIADFRRRLGT